MARFEITGDDARSSRIETGRNLVNDLRLPERPDRRKAAVLFHQGSSSVATAVIDRLQQGLDVIAIEVPDREQAKSWPQVAAVHEQLAVAELGRHDTVIGVGGGAVTDLAGFVAATWLRGIESVYVPTTLLGAVDAAIGGKTGINVGGKNLVGAFWHPALVAIDLDILDALPDNLKREGFAETIKAGFIADQSIVDAFESSGFDVALDAVVPAAVAVKVDVVNEDFRESGRRAILNFGHTLGHAVEIAAGISHGSAVAIGMVAAAAISTSRYGVDLGVGALLERVGLPTSTDCDEAAVRSLIGLDKKRDAGGIRMVLLRDVAHPIVDHVTPAEITVGLSAIGLGG